MAAAADAAHPMRPRRVNQEQAVMVASVHDYFQQEKDGKVEIDTKKVIERTAGATGVSMGVAGMGAYLVDLRMASASASTLSTSAPYFSRALA